MKSIQLHTAAVDNGGHHRDAGEIVAVGDSDRQIVSKKAREILARGGAVEVAAASAKPAGEA